MAPMGWKVERQLLGPTCRNPTCSCDRQINRAIAFQSYRTMPIAAKVANTIPLTANMLRATRSNKCGLLFIRLSKLPLRTKDAIATDDSVSATPAIMTMANAIPASGTPRETANVMTNKVSGHGTRPAITPNAGFASSFCRGRCQTALMIVNRRGTLALTQSR